MMYYNDLEQACESNHPVAISSTFTIHKPIFLSVKHTVHAEEYWEDGEGGH